MKIRESSSESFVGKIPFIKVKCQQLYKKGVLHNCFHGTFLKMFRATTLISTYKQPHDDDRLSNSQNKHCICETNKRSEPPLEALLQK